MTDWTAGYVADIGYTYGYYTELNPLRARLAFLNAGLAVPEVTTACELGFGQGLSANVHAAASTVQWHGTDFNPSQAAYARELAGVSGAACELHDDAFAEFCSRSELPDFDAIGLHGIWSWISDANRAVIVDFVRRKLKVGGVLYISYNTLPGWSTFAPMRHLLTQHADHMGAQGNGIVNRIDAAIEFADKMLATNPAYARANPSVIERLSNVKGQNRNYLAHEYFNADWHPMYFSDMAKWLTPAKLSFACSAHMLDQVDAINLSSQQQALLKEIPDRQMAETVRDFLINQQFRKDYWIKGARQLTVLEQAEGMRKLRVVLTNYRPEVATKVMGALGEASLNESVYKPVLDALADHQPQTLAQLEQSVNPHGVSFAQIFQAVTVLVGAGEIAIAQDEAMVSKARHATDKLNAHLMQKARSETNVSYLASPVTGGGIPVSRFAQLFLLARSQGQFTNGGQPADWAQFAWSLLALQGQRILKDGKAIESPQDNLAELTLQAQAFAQKQLPALVALQIV